MSRQSVRLARTGSRPPAVHFGLTCVDRPWRRDSNATSTFVCRSSGGGLAAGSGPGRLRFIDLDPIDGKHFPCRRWPAFPACNFPRRTASHCWDRDCRPRESSAAEKSRVRATRRTGKTTAPCRFAHRPRGVLRSHGTPAARRPGAEPAPCRSADRSATGRLPTGGRGCRCDGSARRPDFPARGVGPGRAASRTPSRCDSIVR